jgi:hypothetical protein
VLIFVSFAIAVVLLIDKAGGWYPLPLPAGSACFTDDIYK